MGLGLSSKDRTTPIFFRKYPGVLLEERIIWAFPLKFAVSPTAKLDLYTE